jgi:hypothetical protein
MQGVILLIKDWNHEKEKQYQIGPIYDYGNIADAIK